MKKLRAYVPGQTTEDVFWKDGWNVRDPYQMRVGIIAFKTQSDTNQYTLGFYPAVGFSPDAISRTVVATDFMLKQLKRGDTAVEFNTPGLFTTTGERIEPVRVCVLLFQNKILKTIDCEKNKK